MDNSGLVPFRLTPSLSTFTTVCQSRHALLEIIEAASNSILYNPFTILGITRGILRDEELKRKPLSDDVSLVDFSLILCFRLKCRQPS